MDHHMVDNPLVTGSFLRDAYAFLKDGEFLDRYIAALCELGLPE